MNHIESRWSGRAGLLRSAGVFALAQLLLAGTAQAQQAPASATSTPESGTQTAPQDGDAASDRDIVVTGIRASIARATEIKRNSAQVVDAISAQDLGKLPDTNIAEGLQRITGVQIQRTNGEGNRFQIRGSNENLTLINGREVAPDADTAAAPGAVRSVNLFNYPSEVFSEVLVYKSPSASQIEGAVGGTVDLRMPDPLTAPERVLLSGEVSRYNLADKTGYRGTFFASRRFLDDTLGVVVGVTHFNRTNVNDGFNAGSYYSTSTLDVTGDGVADARVLLPFNLTYTRLAYKRVRTTVNALVSWRPTETFNLYLNGSYVTQTNDRSQSQLAYNTSAARAVTPRTALQTQAEADGTTTFLSGPLTNVAITTNGQNEGDTRTLWDGAIGADWQVAPGLRVKAEYARSTSDVDRFASILSTNFTGATAAFDFTPELPTAQLTSAGSVASPNSFVASVVNVRNVFQSPTSDQARLDLSYDFDEGPIRRVAVGVRGTEQSFDNVNLNTRFQDAFPIGRTPSLANFPQFVQVRTLDDFFAGKAGANASTFVVASVPGNPAGGRALLDAFGDPRPLQPLPLSTYEIKERTRAAYAQVDFATDLGSMTFSGNLGLRYVKTRQRSFGSAVTSTNQIVPLAVENDYDDFLPSVNTRLEVVRNLIFRATASKVVARPPIPQLSAGTSVNFGPVNTATSGQPLLRPFRAKQFDLGAEYYFGAASLLSATFFYKNISSYVTTTTTTGVAIPSFPGLSFFLTQPANGPGGKSKGVEAGLQTSFGFIGDVFRDFGVIANYTYVDSKRRGSALPIENTSKHSYNVIGYFESGPFQARAAYNWRSSQYVGVVRAADVYASARGQLDFSVSYDLLENLTLSLEGSDLLQSPQTGYATYTARRNTYDVSDRRLAVGLRARF